MANILVVDDDKTIRLLLRHMLEAETHKVVEADDGDRAVHMMGSRRIDLCIMDMVMRRKSGLEAAEEIRRRDPECGIILMSGIADMDSSEFKHRLSRLGIRHTLVKPFRQKQVVDAVQEMLGS